MLPLEIINAVLREAPSDADRLLCWFINSAPPTRRQTLYERLVTALNSGKLTGHLQSHVPTPSLFTADAAERTWYDLIGQLGTDQSERLEPFFRPNGQSFAPQAYPGRWAPVTWNNPLTPEEVRDALAIEERSLRELKDIASALVEAGSQNPSVTRIGLAALHPELTNAKLRVAVAPYGDGLPMVTMLYAVSDLVEGMAFHPASFYRQSSGDALSHWVEDGSFNAGYATAHQLDKLLAKNHSLVSSRVFPEGFTRSLFLRCEFTRDSPKFDLLSFVGQFGPDRLCEMDESLSHPVVIKHGKLHIQDTYPISERLDPMANWEIPLVLAFAGGVNGYDTKRRDGLALTVSTDAHLWATSFGLNIVEDASDSSTLTEPTFRRAAWNPSAQRGADVEDTKSELCWFVPDSPQSKRLVFELKKSIERYIDRPVSDGLESVKDANRVEVLSEAREKLSPISRAMLAPLLVAHPTYRGPMLAAPPEAWLAKLEGPAEYLKYRPHWYERVQSAGREAPGQSTSLADYMKFVA